MKTPRRQDSDDVRELHKPTSGDWLAIGSIQWEHMKDAANEADVLGTLRDEKRRKTKTRFSWRLPCGETMIAPRLGNWHTDDDGVMTYESTYDRWWYGDDRTHWTPGAIEIYGEGLRENRKPRRTFVPMSKATAKRMFWRLEGERNHRS